MQLPSPKRPSERVDRMTAQTPQGEHLPLPTRPDPPGRDELDLIPHRLRAGDRYTDSTGHVWVGSTTRQGDGGALPGAEDPSAEWRQVWLAHEWVGVRRATLTPKRGLARWTKGKRS